MSKSFKVVIEIGKENENGIVDIEVMQYGDDEGLGEILQQQVFDESHSSDEIMAYIEDLTWDCIKQRLE